MLVTYGYSSIRGRHRIDLERLQSYAAYSADDRGGQLEIGDWCYRITTSCWSRSRPHWRLSAIGRSIHPLRTALDRRDLRWEMAAAFGVDIFTLVYTLTFVIGAMLGALGGAMMAPKIAVALGIGVEVIVLALR